MKTKMCRPVLVLSKEYSDLIMCAVDNTLFKTEHYGSIMESSAGKDSYQELILISLDPDEKIGVGEYYLHEYTNYSEIVKNTSTRHYGGKSKIIVRQSQLPDEYIQQFISEYNRGGVVDVLIEMEVITEPVQDGDWNKYTQYLPKLTNGFITICDSNYSNRCSPLNINKSISKEPITYTEEEVYRMCKTSFEMYMTNEYSDDELVKVFEDWFNNNKKK